MPFRAFATGNDETTSGADNSFTITVPATVQAGDVMLVIAVQNTGTQTYTISGGGTGATWTTQSGPDDLSSNQRTYLWSETASASSAGSTITVNANGTGRFIGHLLVLSGVTEAGMIVSPPSGDSTADTTLDFQDVTVATPGSDLVVLGSMRAAAATAATVSGVPTGYTLRGSTNTNIANPNYTVFALTSDTTVATGTQGPPNGTASSAVTDQLYTVALASSAQDFAGTMAVAGSGALSFAGSKPNLLGALAVTATGTLSFAGSKPGGVGGLTLTGSGTLVLAGVPRPAGALAVTGVGTLAFLVTSGSGTLAVTGSGALALSGSPRTAGVLTRTGSGVLALGGVPRPGGVLTLTGSGVLTLLLVARFQWWDGTEWRRIAPLVWDGGEFIQIPVTLTEPTPQL